MNAIRFKNVTSNLDQSCEDMRKFWPDALVSYSGKTPFYSNVNGLILENSSFSDNATVQGLSISGLRFDACHLISIPIAGHSAHRFEGQIYSAGNQQAVFQHSGAEISAWPLSHVRTFQVTLNKSAYENLVTNYLGLERDENTTYIPEIELKSDFGRSIAVLSKRMFQWLNNPAFDFNHSGLILKLFEQSFLQAVVEYQAQSWSYLNQNPVAEPFYIKMAEEYIRNHLLDGLNLSNIAESCGISGRTLQLGFQKHRGYSPTEFSRNLRLEAARSDLLSPDFQMNVTRIAMKWGFSHFSRFANEYRKRFYELPSETIMKSR
jgi:AraC-like DNA-binding protein